MATNKADLIKAVEKDSLRTDLPHFEVGDTVEVHLRLSEGEKERIQVFAGTVISIRGGGVNRTFTVRRMVGSEGVERVFSLNSPLIASVEVRKHGKVRRAKLYYLRGRTGRKASLTERKVYGKSASRASLDSGSPDDTEEAAVEASAEKTAEDNTDNKQK